MKQNIRLAFAAGILLASLGVAPAYAVTAQCTFDSGKVASATCTGNTVPSCDFKTKTVKCSAPAKSAPADASATAKPASTAMSADKPKK